MTRRGKRNIGNELLIYRLNQRPVSTTEREKSSSYKTLCVVSFSLSEDFAIVFLLHTTITCSSSCYVHDLRPWDGLWSIWFVCLMLEWLYKHSKRYYNRVGHNKGEKNMETTSKSSRFLRLHFFSDLNSISPKKTSWHWKPIYNLWTHHSLSHVLQDAKSSQGLIHKSSRYPATITS